MRPLFAEGRPLIDPGGACVVHFVRQDFPQKQSRADLVLPRPAVGAARLDHARVRDARRGMTRHIHDAAAMEREVVRHESVVPPRDDSGETRGLPPNHKKRMIRTAVSATAKSAARIHGSQRSVRGVGYIMGAKVPATNYKYNSEMGRSP